MAGRIEEWRETPRAEKLIRMAESIEKNSQSMTAEELKRIRNALNWIDDEAIKDQITGNARFKVVLDKRRMAGFNRRSEIEVIASILDIARSSIKKTKIMYQANLSYTQLQKYLAFLTNIEFLAVDGRAYRTTKRGEEFLFYWTKMLALLETR